jgi:hypothetical protein
MARVAEIAQNRTLGELAYANSHEWRSAISSSVRRALMLCEEWDHSCFTVASIEYKNTQFQNQQEWLYLNPTTTVIDEIINDLIINVTTTLLDHLKASSAHPSLRHSHPFLLQQLSQVSQSAVFFEPTIDKSLLLPPPNLNWVEIWRVSRPHHSVSEEMMPWSYREAWWLTGCTHY